MFGTGRLMIHNTELIQMIYGGIEFLKS